MAQRYRPLVCAPLALAAFILATFPVAGGAQTQNGAVKLAWQASLTQAIQALGVQVNKSTSGATALTAEQKLQQIQTTVAARKGTPTANDGLATQLAQTNQLVAATQTDLARRLALITRLGGVMNQVEMELVGMRARRLKLTPAQGTELLRQFAELHANIQLESAEIAKDQQTLQTLANSAAKVQDDKTALRVSELASLQTIAAATQKQATLAAEQARVASILAAATASSNQVRMLVETTPKANP
jgi:prolyl oligopeptidase PreP (S9A serine peptidase family)